MFNKLNAFAAEIDRDRTRIEAIASAYIWLKREVKEGAEILKPVLGQVERVLDKFAKAKELPEALPPPRRGGEIEGPRKELPAPKEHALRMNSTTSIMTFRSDCSSLRAALSQPMRPARA